MADQDLEKQGQVGNGPGTHRDAIAATAEAHSQSSGSGEPAARFSWSDHSTTRRYTTETHDTAKPSHPHQTRHQRPHLPGAQKVTPDGKIIHTWTGPDDPENPFNWSPTYKWIVTVTICFVSILTGLPAGSYGAGSSDISEQFGVRSKPFDNTIWATVSWNLGAALWPLVFVPLTESKGRMPGYFGAYGVFVAFLFGSAFAQNFATLVVTRFVCCLSPTYYRHAY